MHSLTNDVYRQKLVELQGAPLKFSKLDSLMPRSTHTDLQPWIFFSIATNICMVRLGHKATVLPNAWLPSVRYCGVVEVSNDFSTIMHNYELGIHVPTKVIEDLSLAQMQWL